MGTWIDLHMHSNMSDDGEFSPTQLMQMCAKQRLTAVALTDHNSVRGNAKAREEAKRTGMQFIAGIELDCRIMGRNLHLLGYGIDDKAACFGQVESEVEAHQRGTAAAQLDLVRQLGICFDDEQVMKLAVNGVVNAEMIAEVALADSRNDGCLLLKPYRSGGSRSDNPYVNFYWDFCSQDKPAYVPIDFMELADAVRMVQSTGGIAVLAHPGINVGRDRDLLHKIMGCGIDGIEAYSSYHDASAMRYYAEIAAAHDLCVTLGSDFHGKIKPSILLGHMEFDDPANMLSAVLARIEKTT